MCICFRVCFNCINFGSTQKHRSRGNALSTEQTYFSDSFHYMESFPLNSLLLLPSFPPSLPVAPGLFCDPGCDFALLVLPADPVQGCAFPRHHRLHPGNGMHGGRRCACGKASGSRWVSAFTGLLASVGETKARRGMFTVHGGNKEPGLPTVCVLLVFVPLHLGQWHIGGASYIFL